MTYAKMGQFMRKLVASLCCVYQLSADCTKRPLKRKCSEASSQAQAGLIPIITHHAYSKQQGMKDRGRVMRLLLLARDYAQSFFADKRSEEQMWRMGRGKPSVLISDFRECTLVSNLRALNILPGAAESLHSAALMQLPALHWLLLQAVSFLPWQIPYSALQKWTLRLTKV